MSYGYGHAPGQRQLRVGEEIRHALAATLASGALRDPGLRNISITITEVRTTPDLKHAQVYIVPLGGENMESVLKVLHRARPFLRRQVARAVYLKHVPDLHFKPDISFDNADHIGALLRDPRVKDDTQCRTDD